MLNFLSITKALADESRLRVLIALNGLELCVCQVTELLGLAPSTVSKHMAILTQARLVEYRKDGRWRYYRQAGDKAPPEVREAISWVRRSLLTADGIRQDAVKLEKFLTLSAGRVPWPCIVLPTLIKT